MGRYRAVRHLKFLPSIPDAIDLAGLGPYASCEAADISSWARRAEHVAAALGNFREGPAHDAVAVEQELADELAVPGRYHLLVGFGDLVAVLLVEKIGCRERVHRLGQFARQVDPHRHRVVMRDLVRPGGFVLGESRLGRPKARCEARSGSEAASRSGIG